MKITDIDYSRLKVESDKEGNGEYSRTIYYDDANLSYIKIWAKDFFYRDLFEEVYRSTKFFETVSAITDVITDDEDNILGYITKAGAPACHSNLDGHKYRDLRDRLIAASKEFNVVYLDMNPTNAVDIDGRYYLVDLEASIPVDRLFEVPSIKSIWEYNDYLYRNEINKSICSIDDGLVRVVRQGSYPYKDIKYGTANGRIYLENEYLSTLTGRTLFVGVNYYTDFYHRLTQTPEKFETLDILETVIEHGSPYKHYVCNILDFEQQGYLYDNVCFFGILGHYDDWDIIKKEDEAIKTIKLLHNLVEPGGTLLIGPAANNHFNMDFWDEVYNLPELSGYDVIMKKKIDINYIWYGRKK